MKPGDLRSEFRPVAPGEVSLKYLVCVEAGEGLLPGVIEMVVVDKITVTLLRVLWIQQPRVEILHLATPFRWLLLHLLRQPYG